MRVEGHKDKLRGHRFNDTTGIDGAPDDLFAVAFDLSAQEDGVASGKGWPLDSNGGAAARDEAVELSVHVCLVEVEGTADAAASSRHGGGGPFICRCHSFHRRLAERRTVQWVASAGVKTDGHKAQRASFLTAQVLAALPQVVISHQQRLWEVALEAIEFVLHDFIRILHIGNFLEDAWGISFIIVLQGGGLVHALAEAFERAREEDGVEDGDEEHEGEKD